MSDRAEEAEPTPRAYDPENFSHQDRGEDFPHFGGDDGRDGDPTPPGSVLEPVGTATASECKRVMLNAERHDEIEIQVVVNGLSDVPKDLTVVRRTEPYFGPQLMCSAEYDGETSNWLLTCPGPRSQLILWQSLTGVDGKWRSGFVPVSEVRAKIAGTEQYRICEECGEPLRDLWHERLAVFGIPHGSEADE